MGDRDKGGRCVIRMKEAFFRGSPNDSGETSAGLRGREAIGVVVLFVAVVMVMGFTVDVRTSAVSLDSDGDVGCVIWCSFLWPPPSLSNIIPEVERNAGVVVISLSVSRLPPPPPATALISSPAEREVDSANTSNSGADGADGEVSMGKETRSGCS